MARSSLTGVSKGIAAEYLAKAYFSKRGCRIYTPDTHASAYDFLVEKNGYFEKVQVKSAITKTDYLVLRNHHGSTNRRYSMNDYDILCGVWVEENYIWLYRSQDINGDDYKIVLRPRRLDGKPFERTKRALPFEEGNV